MYIYSISMICVKKWLYPTVILRLSYGYPTVSIRKWGVIDGIKNTFFIKLLRM